MLSVTFRSMVHKSGAAHSERKTSSLSAIFSVSVLIGYMLVQNLSHELDHIELIKSTSAHSAAHIWYIISRWLVSQCFPRAALMYNHFLHYLFPSGYTRKQIYKCKCQIWYIKLNLFTVPLSTSVAFLYVPFPKQGSSYPEVALTFNSTVGWLLLYVCNYFKQLTVFMVVSQ